MAGYLVGEVSGETWEGYVRRRILEPLEMGATSFSLEIKDSGDYSLPYMFIDGKATELPLRKKDVSGPSGGMNSNVEDMAKWLIFHLGQGKFGDRQLVSDENLAVTHSPQMPVGYTPGSATGPLHDYGMGWNIQPYQGHHLIHHGGWIEGYVSWISFMPFDGLGVVVLCNMTDCVLPYFLHYVIYNRLLGLEKIDWKRIIDNYTPQYFNRFYHVKRTSKSDPAELPLPLEEYAGSYDHPVYGRLEVAIQDNALHALFNGERIELIQRPDGDFLTDHISELFGGNKVSFILSDSDKIEKLELAFRQGGGKIVFSRLSE